MTSTLLLGAGTPGGCQPPPPLPGTSTHTVPTLLGEGRCRPPAALRRPRRGAGVRGPGAPLGNTNALKHGFYSRAFRAAEQSDLAAITDVASLENEIQLMRVFILRIAQRETDDLTFTESLALLNVLARASLSLGSLLRTQRTAANGNLHAQLEKLFAAGRAEFARAHALVERLTRRIEELEAAAAASTTPGAASTESPAADEDSESDDEYCDPPIDCLTCSDIADCPHVRPHIRDLVLSLNAPDPSPTPPPDSTIVVPPAASPCITPCPPRPP